MTSLPDLPDPSSAPASPLLGWFDRHQRPMPWRAARDPYAIWISEIMLQQTQVATVIPYFERFMARFPTVEGLAKAPLDDVLKCWEGLGYYRRSRHLHQAAQRIATRHGGRFPTDYALIRELPGIGPYTAGAVAAIAFNQPYPAVDGNVFRVLARVFALDDDTTAPAGRARFEAIAGAMIPPGEAGKFNQALMELGALVCTPQRPACEQCPWGETCRARASGRPDAFPVKIKRVKVQPLTAVVALVHDPAGKVLLIRRPEGGLLGGLWEFPSFEVEGEALEGLLKREFQAKFGVELMRVVPLATVSHSFTHRKARYHAFTGICGAIPETVDVRWVGNQEGEALAVPHVMRRLRAAWQAHRPRRADD